VDREPLEREVQAIGRDLAAAFPSPMRWPLKAVDAKAMELASADAELRAALFRFVDVVPACRGVDDLARHLTAFLDEVDERTPPLSAAMRMAETKPGRAALGAAAAAGVRHMAHRFIVGETPRDAIAVIRDLWRHGVASSVDLLGEATVTQVEADRYAARCRDALDQLVAAHARWPGRPQLEADSLGPLPRANLSVKVSALTPLDHGGNMDVPDVKPGNTVYLPVRAPGALFFTGDCHAGQGDGELCGVALEITARVTLQFDVIKQRPIAWPRIESADELMVVGSARPMEDAARIAYTELVGWLVELGWDRWEAYEALTQIGRLYVGNMVDTYYSLVAKIEKRYAHAGGAA